MNNVDPQPGWRPTGPPNRYDDPASVEIIGQLDKRLLSSLLIAREAEQSGAAVEWFGSDTFIASTPDGRELLFKGNRCNESVPATKVVRDKALVKQLLNEAGVGTPAGGRAGSLAEAMCRFEAIGGPVVVKPAKGDRGKGITVGVSRPDQLERAFHQATAFRSSVLIEQFVAGAEFRCMATTNECVGVVGRDPPNVVGDSVHTIEELIARKNELRRQNPSLRDRPIRLDGGLASILERSGLTLHSIPEQGIKVYVGGAANLTVGGDSVDYADSVPDLVKETAAAAVRAIPGLNWAGVDIILRSPDSSVVDSFEAFVLEINVNAGISGFHYPVYGAPRNLARELWQLRVRAAPPAGPDRTVTVGGQSRRPADLHPPPPVVPPADRGRYPDQVNLGALLADYLAASGRTVELLAPRLIRFRDGAVDSLRYGCTGDQDLAIPSQILSRRATLRRVLHSRGLRVAAGRIARSEADVRSFLESTDVPARLLRTRGDSGLVLAELTPPPDEAVIATVWQEAARNGPVYLQTRPPGTRLRVLATRQDAPAVVCAPAVAQEATALSRTLVRAQQLAVDAVSAIPELRWAAVDMVVPRNAPAGPDRQRPVVEAMTTHPSLPAEDRLVVGSLEAFFAAIESDSRRGRVRTRVRFDPREWRRSRASGSE